MKAIILAAGIGNRLGKHSNNKPKSLLEFNDKSLLKRHIEILKAHNIEDIIIVIGFESKMIVEHLDNQQIPIHYILNERYTEGSILSLECAREILLNESEYLLMDADVLYDKEIITRLINTKIKNCLLLDRNFLDGDEPVKICVDENGNINEFGKIIPDEHKYNFHGESVGFFKFDNSIGRILVSIIDDYILKNGSEKPYEEVIRDSLLKSPEKFGFEDITEIPWIEIDFPEDIERARKTIMPKLTKI
tara:strand:+ start:11 stop:754 length:744 start_codon:yes stop_codon:yes gene_type:complete